MTYQNNNNRLTPNATEDRNLKPAATPTDKLIRYNPTNAALGGDSGTKLGNTAIALASLGKGMMAIDTLLHYQSQENAIQAIQETENLGGNKEKWAEVSKNIKGAAKFNPYNDDAYRNLQAQDIYRKAALELSTTPELEKVDTEKFYQLVSDKNKEMFEAFKQTGLSPKDYAPAVLQWDSQMKKLETNYIEKHAEYTYQQLQTKQASDLSFQAGTALTENSDLDKSVVLRDVVNSKIEELTKLGVPEDTQVKVIVAGLKGFLSKNADNITSAEFKAAIDDLTINGKKASELIPDYDYNVKLLYKQAQQAIYEDKSIAFQNHQLDLKISEQQAMKDLYDWTKQNPNASYSDTFAQAQDLVEKYNLEEIGFSFIKEMASNKSTLTELQNAQSDPSILQELGAKAALGTLTGEDVNNAVINHQLHWKDALSFTDRINREAKQEVAAVKTSFNDFHSKLGKNGIYGQALGADSKDIKDINAAANQLIIDLNNGKKTADEVNSGLEQLERITQAKAQIKGAKATNDSFLMDANYIRSQQAPVYSAEKAVNAFKQLGLERGEVGQKVQPRITSAPNDNRKINGKAAPHKGYDLGATGETKIHTAPMEGTVIYAGYLKDLGNYVVIKYSNGSYMRVGHLAKSTTHLQGKKLSAGHYIGRAGSSGYSTGTHLHVEFWDKNRQLISVEKFQRGIK